MKRSSIFLVIALLVAMAGLAGCKSSGAAVTAKGQIMKINIETTGDLAEGEEGKIMVEVANRGINNLHDVEFEVEIPGELIVLDENHGQGMEMSQSIAANGNKIYHYRVGDIQATDESEATYRVRTAFGGRDRSGDIIVRAWQKDLPNNSMKETRYIKFRS